MRAGVRGEIKLKIISLNVRGLIGNNKRWKVFLWLKQQKVDITLIQETHCTVAKLSCFKLGWEVDSYYSTTSSAHSRGVGVLFNPKLNLKINDH